MSKTNISRCLSSEEYKNLPPFLEDITSSNDLMSSFVNWPARIKLWADYEDRSMSEYLENNPGSKRFTIFVAVDYDEETRDQKIIQVDTMAEICHAYAAQWMRNVAFIIGPGFHPDTPVDEYHPPLQADIAEQYEVMIDFCHKHLEDPYLFAMEGVEKYWATPKYLREFMQFDDDLSDLAPFLKDISYRNEDMPSFVNEDAGIKVFIDYNNIFRSKSYVTSEDVGSDIVKSYEKQKENYYRFSVEELTSYGYENSIQRYKSKDVQAFREHYAKLWLEKAFEKISDLDIDNVSDEQRGGSLLKQVREMVEFCKQNIPDIHDFVNELKQKSAGMRI